MATMEKTGARSACDMLKSHPETLLVCAYEGEEEFHQNHLEGAISLPEFLSRKDSLRKDQPIIFYCACPHDEAANGQSRKYRSEGFTNVKVLEGGVNAWREAGCPILAAV